jgi:hypothetical protein
MLGSDGYLKCKEDYFFLHKLLTLWIDENKSCSETDYIDQLAEKFKAFLLGTSNLSLSPTKQD